MLDFKKSVLIYYAALTLKSVTQPPVYLSKEDKEALTEANSDFETHSELISKKSVKAREISERYGVKTDIVSFPAPLMNGPTIPLNIYESIINDNSYGKRVTQELVLDKIHQSIGQIENQIKKDLFNIFNPFFWLRIILKKIVRFPFEILKASGFNIEKIEDHFLSKLFKALEIAVLFFLLLKIGLNKIEIANFIKNLLLK